ncbi:MAG: hypothetical protein KDB79_16015 [Acidobacteria bacterium]|nr:hypothetical protein [Acidobacteriota bacterium]
MMQNQPSLFDEIEEKIPDEKVILYALGDFQSRGKLLAGRELPLERLLGAFHRAFDRYGIEPLNDRDLAEILGRLGAEVIEVPDFVAIHPFRVRVSADLAEKAKALFDAENTSD